MNVVVFSFFLLLLLCLYVGGACLYSLPYLGILTTDGVPQRLVKTSPLVPVLMESLVLSGVLTLLIEVLPSYLALLGTLVKAFLDFSAISPGCCKPLVLLWPSSFFQNPPGIPTLTA